MKIRKTTPTEQYLKELRQRQDQQATVGGPNKRKSTDAEEVNISLGRHINSELNIEQLLADRKARVEDLKQQIQNGEYDVSSKNIAQALATELSFEIAETRVEEV